MQEQDLEARGIAQPDLQLHSQLQAALDKDQQINQPILTLKDSPVNALSKRERHLSQSMSDAASLPSSARPSSESGFYSSTDSTINSPITPHQHTASLLDHNVCACHHWLVSIDTEHCSLCDASIPMLTEWQADRSLKSQTIERSESQLGRLMEKEKEQEEQIAELQQLEQDTQARIKNIIRDMASMRQDLQILHVKYQDETSQIEEIQRAKESVKRELEDLSQKLFEEANEMINIEKREKQQLQKTHDALAAQLSEVQYSLEAVTKELDVLRANMSLLSKRQTGAQIPTKDAPETASATQDPIPPQSETTTAAIHINPDVYMLRANIDLTMMHNDSLQVQIEASEDDQTLVEFAQFMDTVTTQPLNKLHSLPFIKHCLQEDIRPTLRFGPNPRIAARKIIDAILAKTCIIEPCPPGFAKRQLANAQPVAGDTLSSLWGRFTSPPAFHGCQACGRQVNKNDVEKTLNYRFRTSYLEEWVCIDRYCRDRLEAVVQFYEFLRHIRSGDYRSRSLTDVYQECSRLRLQMLFCRMGVLPATLQGLGLGASTVGKATLGQIGEDTKYRGNTMEETRNRPSTSAASAMTV